MVLDDKGAGKAEPLGLDIVFDEVAEPLGAVELAGLRRIGPPRRRAAEQPELHRPASARCVCEGRRRAAMFKMPVAYPGYSGGA